MLFLGGSIQIAALFVMGGLGASSPDPPDSFKVGIIAMLAVFGFGFCSGWAPVSHILSADPNFMAFPSPGRHKPSRPAPGRKPRQAPQPEDPLHR